MIRRRPFELPFAEQVPVLAALMRDGCAGESVGDQERLLEAALAHGLGPMLAAADESGTIALDDRRRRRLGRVCAMRLARAEALRAELDLIAPTLTDVCGSPPVCVKGPAVADRLYDGDPRRSFGDLDLVVPRERLDDAAAALADAGWVEDLEFAPGFAARFGHELHQRRRRGGIWLLCELHWRIGDDPLCERLDYGLLASGATPLERHPAVLAAARPAELLLLCVHFLGDRERRLIWIDDIRRAAERADAGQWEQSFSLASSVGLSWALHRGLDYAERYVGLHRQRPAPPGPPPPFGPLRATEELEMRASLHVGRLAMLRGLDRLRYLRTVLIPTAAGLEGTAGVDGAPRWRVVLRHIRSAVAGILPRR